MVWGFHLRAGCCLILGKSFIFVGVDFLDIFFIKSWKSIFSTFFHANFGFQTNFLNFVNFELKNPTNIPYRRRRLLEKSKILRSKLYKTIKKAISQNYLKNF